MHANGGVRVCRVVVARWLRERMEEEAGRTKETRSIRTRNEGRASGGELAGSVRGWGGHDTEQCPTTRLTRRVIGRRRETRTGRVRRRRERSGRGWAKRRTRAGAVAQTEHG